MTPSKPPLQTAEQEIVRLYLAGHSATGVAALLRAKPSQIYTTLRRLGVPRRPRGHVKGATYNGKLTLQQREQLRADLRSEVFPTLQAIGLKYGVTRETVRLNAAAIGVTRYTIKGRSETLREHARLRQAAARAAREAQAAAFRQRLAELWQSGVTPAEIARILDLGTASRANHAIARHRRRFPADFPRRRAAPRREPHVLAAERAARAVRVAARRAEVERRRALLAALWQRRASRAEISRALGLSVATSRSVLRKYRRRFPADFPPRTAPSTAQG